MYCTSKYKFNQIQSVTRLLVICLVFDYFCHRVSYLVWLILILGHICFGYLYWGGKKAVLSLRKHYSFVVFSWGWAHFPWQRRCWNQRNDAAKDGKCSQKSRGEKTPCQKMFNQLWILFILLFFVCLQYICLWLISLSINHLQSYLYHCIYHIIVFTIVYVVQNLPWFTVVAVMVYCRIYYGILQ